VEALRVARGRGSHIFRHSAHRCRHGCQPYAPTAFYPQEDSWYSFPLKSLSQPQGIVRLQGLGKLNNPPQPGLEQRDLPACNIVKVAYYFFYCS
jgi:hypothetical protein